MKGLLRDCPYQGPYLVAPLELLRHIPLILTKPGQNLTLEVMHTLGKKQMEPDILLETSNLTAAINLAAKGIACACVPEEGAKICLHPGEVTYFFLDGINLVWNLAAVYRKDTYLTKLSRLFIDCMREQIGEREHCDS